MPVTTCVFDAYGTLFDVAAAARIAAEQPGQQKLAEVWPKLAADWRQKQLQYTWLRAITGDHVPFWDVTQDGLDWAMEASGLDDPELRETLQRSDPHRGCRRETRGLEQRHQLHRDDPEDEAVQRHDQREQPDGQCPGAALEHRRSRHC